MILSVCHRFRKKTAETDGVPITESSESVRQSQNVYNNPIVIEKQNNVTNDIKTNGAIYQNETNRDIEKDTANHNNINGNRRMNYKNTESNAKTTGSIHDKEKHVSIVNVC